MQTGRSGSHQQDMYEVEFQQDLRVPTGDPDVTLSADVYLPAGAAPVPALLTVVPYRKDIRDVDTYAASYRWFAQRGYAGVQIDLRGIGSSDGDRRPKYDSSEGEDAVAAIEWITSQPWCNGNVGMWGHSYGGLISMRAAQLKPPQLKAIITLQSPLDPGVDVAHPGGSRGDLLALASWGGGMLLEQLIPPLINHSSHQEQQRWRRRLHEIEPYILEISSRGPDDDVWQERAVNAESITLPALCVGGWRDVVCDATVRTFEKLQGPKQLLMGPWQHRQPQDSPDEQIDFLPMALRWWDHWLRGVDNGVMDEAPVTIYIQGKDPGWRTYETWPPAKDELVLRTNGDTTLAATPPEIAPTTTSIIGAYRADPTIGALSGPFVGLGLPLDQHDDDMRSLTVTSEPLREDLLICGRAAVSVAIASGTPRQLAVRLTEVDRDGRSTLITAATTACSQDSTGMRQIALQPTTYLVPAGHSLRVALSDSQFPKLTPLANPGDFPVTSIALSLPTMSADAGVPAAITHKDRGSVGQNSRWSITRDPVHEAVTATTGRPPTRIHTREGHILERESLLSATVRRHAPSASVTTGTHNAVICMSTGETINATTVVRCTQDAVWVRGEVTIDGMLTFARIWERPLT